MGLSDCKVGPVMAVTDMERARAFYEGGLGLTGKDGPGGARLYRCGEGTELGVYLSPDHAGKDTSTRAGFDVADVEALVDELVARGVEVARFDGMEADAKGIVSYPGGRAAFIKDPDGNTIALVGG